MKILNEIQQKLKAPKDRKNSFGNYMYRSCEDILEAVKPLLNGAVLTLSDEIIQFTDSGSVTVTDSDKSGSQRTVVMPSTRFYVKATATLTYGGETHSVSAYAREAFLKKGMDEGQITGSASSYARKYALNGLFCIDDTADNDVPDFDEPEAKNKLKESLKPNEAQQKVIDEVYKKLIDSTPEGKSLCKSKIAALLFATSKTGTYPTDIKQVGTISAWIISEKKIDSLCEVKK